MSVPTSYSYQWLRDGVPILGATSSTYTLVVADVGAIIGVTVTATNSAGSGSVTVSETSVVQAQGSVSSAGVFDSSDRLVRTLWSAQTNDPRAANPAAAWDGTLDDLSVAPTGTYTVKLLTSDCTYTWDGVVGNSCPDHPSTPITYLSGATVMWSMAIADTGDVFYCSAYHEKNSTVYFTTESDMNHAFNPYWWPDYPVSYGTLTWSLGNGFHFCCTDSTIAYFALFQEPSYVKGVDVVTKAQVMFAAGDPSGNIGIYDNSGGVGAIYNYITSVAVQKVGGYLFIARQAANQIWVLDKTTGATVRKDVSLPLPNIMAVSPTTGDLWVSYEPAGHTAIDTVIKITVDGAGNFTPTAVTISINEVSAMAISPDGLTLLMLDSTTQQVKAYNTTDGTAKAAWGNAGTLGQAGGYATSPAVTDDKFMFLSIAGGQGGSPGGFLCYSSDGSWWLGDNGNYRHLHFSSGNSPTLIEKTCYVPSDYACEVCRGDDTRVFGNFLEWKIDYSLPLEPSNGSWILQNNWSYGLTSDNFYNQSAMGFVGIYSNGRTYCTFWNIPTDHRDIVELTSSGPRFTGLSMHNQNYLAYNMDIYTATSVTGSGTQIMRLPFAGFDLVGNPTYPGDPLEWAGTGFGVGWTVSATFGVLPADFPRWDLSLPIEPLSNGTTPLFNARHLGENHVGSIDLTSGDWKCNTHPETRSYTGGPLQEFTYYPDAPYFGTNGGGSSTNYGGFLIYRPGAADFFTNFRGELWCGGQTNIISHWHESGLLINRFGSVSPAFAAFPPQGPSPTGGLPESGSSFYGQPYRAGNSNHGGLALQNGVYYLFQGEEWVHSGNHRSTIGNLGSISFATVATVNWDAGSYVPPTPDPTDMLAGLPYDTIGLPNNTAGWVRTPVADIDVGPPFPTGTPRFSVMTNMVLEDPRVSPDLLYWTSGVLLGDLPIQLKKQVPRTGTGNWVLTMTASIRQDQIYWDKGANQEIGTWIEIVDSAGKKIVSVWPHLRAGLWQTIWVNEQPMFDQAYSLANFPGNNLWKTYLMGGSITTEIDDGSQLDNLKELTISANVGAGTMTVSYGPYSIAGITVYEVGADITDPTEFQLNFRLQNFAGGSGNPIAIKRLNFVG